jgi:hypothetical protein
LYKTRAKVGVGQVDLEVRQVAEERRGGLREIRHAGRITAQRGER